MVFLLVVPLLELIVSERVFLDPLVAQTIAGKVLHAIEQIHGSVVFTFMCRLQKGIEPVEKLVTDRREQNILSLVMCSDIFFQIPDDICLLSVE